MMNFDEIVLTRSELSALKFLSKSSAVIVEKSNREELERLRFFDFAEFYTIADPEARKIAVEKTGMIAPQGAKITDLGKSYLAYNAAKEKSERRSARRDLLFTLIGAAITFLLDHHALIVVHLQRIFQIWQK